MNAILFANLESLRQSVAWLNRSYENCQTMSLESLTERELIELEALTSRFARTVDMLVQKILRSIDYVELETQGTLIDVVNRAHKRGIVDDVETLRGLKDLRNSIAHEYREQDLIGLFSLVLKQTPVLLSYVQRAEDYIETRLSSAG